MSDRANHISRRDHGYIMLVTLGAILVLTVTGTFLYLRTQRHLSMATAVKLQGLATSRAMLGAEAVIAQMKTSPPAAIQSLLSCVTPSTLAQCKAQGRVITGASGIITIAQLDNGAGDLASGGGLQYSVDVYVRTNVADIQHTLVLDSWGYYGYSGSPNLISAQTQVEMSMPSSGAGGPLGTAGGYPGGS